ncbi:MAG: sodium/glutamate symporter [Bacteroidaceae bacterium]|jgi:ESS family glutamate:Na+ symporter|nr:hypothetical protein [Bacteroidaceae bacterium]NLA95106.1 hypothetical protein [Bacteroidales bacterium]HOD69372.1 sodium/glutamate symporter [Bacteroidaceae bacterium]HPB03744.1 sodium/glutamate symporter [Bacteroidaceae bacterium]HQL26845.1 sodium/glutamate symporter [Bacteroidaceae bacterium]
MYLSSSGIAVKSFAAPEVWSTLIQVFVVLLAVLAGNTLRRKVRFLRRSLIPTALLGGLIILLFKFWPKFNDIIDKRFMETMTYHALALGFISMSLRPTKVSNRSNTRTVVETGTLTVGTYIIQGIVGLLITVPMYLFWRNPEAGRDIFYAGGLMLPMGYGQGPGQALNFGTIYQSVAAEQGINFQGIDFGLSIAAIGFLIGSIVGVIYMNILAHKNRLTLKEQETDTRYTLYDYDQGNELPHSESVDKLTIVISIVFMTYFFVYLFMSFIGRLELGDFGEKTVKPLVYGFNFFWGILFASLVRVFIRSLRKKGLMHREYLNEYLLNRVGGTAFDLMIVAGTAAICFENLRSIWLPLTLLCIAGAIATFYYVKKVSMRIYPSYGYEGFFSMFGMLTGTASNGMILLREIDPRYETPAANNLVLQNIPAMIMGFPILLLLGFAPKNLSATLITLGILVVLFTVVNLFLFRKRVR